MIYVDREAVDEQGVMIRPSDGWFDSASNATNVAIAEGGDHDADGLIERWRN